MAGKSDETESFTVEAFSAAGDHEGSGLWSYGQLSEKWIGICRQVIDHFGPIFDYQWSRELAQVRTKLTFVRGAGILTIFVHDRTAASVLVMSGADRGADADIARRYVDALLSSVPTEMLVEGHRFSGVHSLPNRPVMVVVPFPDPQRSETDEDLVRELGWHFAAAIFQWWGDQPKEAGSR